MSQCINDCDCHRHVLSTGCHTVTFHGYFTPRGLLIVVTQFDKKKETGVFVYVVFSERRSLVLRIHQ